MSEKNITIEEVEYTAGLARLELSNKEKKKFAGDLDNILGYFKDLNEADTAKAQKLNHYKLVSNKDNYLRADELKISSEDTRAEIKNNFPARKKELLAVKSVLKKK